MSKREVALSRKTRLRLHLRGAWSAEEFGKLFRTTNDLYCMSSLLARKDFRDSNPFSNGSKIDRRTIQLIASSAKIPILQIREIRYASPGFSDFTGLGKALEQFKELALGITDRCLQSAKRKLEEEQLRLGNAKTLSDQRFLEEERERLSRRAEEIHQVELQTRRIENSLTVESVRKAQLLNTRRELKFEKTISRQLQQSTLSSAEQAQVVQWIGSRSKSIETLAEDGKLVGAEVILDDDDTK